MPIVPYPTLFDGRVCITCRVWKPFTCYTPRKFALATTPNYYGDCKACRSARSVANRRKKVTDAETGAAYLARQAERQRAWNAQHPLYAHALNKRWRCSVEGRAWKRAWRLKHREKVNRGNRQKYLADPERFHHYHRTRRARRTGAEGSHTLREWNELKSRYNFRCACCFCPETPGRGRFWRLTKDHIVPLSLGGTDYIWNIAPLCFECNSRKGASHHNFRWDRLLPSPP